MSTRARTQTGFTLFELMVTIGVAGLLLGLGVPSFTAFTKNANIISAANTLLSDMHYARDLAVTRNQRVGMCPSDSGLGCDSPNWAEGWIVFVDNDNDLAFDAGEPIERVGDELPGLSLTTAQFGASLTYRPNGRAMGATIATNKGAFLMCDNRGAPHARGIVVDVSGRPRVSHLAKLGIVAPCPAI